MSAPAALLTWLGLMALLAAQLLAVWAHGPAWLPPAAGVAMALLVCLVFMRLRRAGTLSAIFAMAGVVWLGIMFGVGAMDSATRHDIPVSPTTPP